MVVYMIKSLTVRPKPEDGEALSSFISHVCELNKISVLEIWNTCSEDNLLKVDRKMSFKFDLFASDIIDFGNLSTLISQPIEHIRLHTFEPFVLTMYGREGKRIMSREVETKFKRFCRSCLKESKRYKLLWHVKEIVICNRHLTKLESNCLKCGYQQPYQISQYSNICFHCKSYLSDQKEIKVFDITFIKRQVGVYKDWESILDLQKTKAFQKLSPQKLQRKIAMTMFFIATKNIENYSYKNHNYFSKSQVRKLINLIKSRQEDNISSSFILKVIRDFDISVNEFINTRVPISFQRFLLNIGKVRNKVRNKVIPKCITKWCECYDSNEEIKLLDKNPKKYVPKRHLYKNTSVCTNCWIIIGQNKKTLEWESINLSFKLVLEVDNEINEGSLTYTKVSKELDIHKIKVAFYIGYIYRYKKPLNGAMWKYKEIDINELIQCFKELRPFWRCKQSLAKKAKILFGWEADETYYYFWHPKIQEFIYLVNNNSIRDMKKHEDFKKNLWETINNYKKNGINLSIKEVAATLDISDVNISYHGQNQLIKKVKLKNKEKEKIHEKEILIESIHKIINEKEKQEEKILVKDIYNFIGKSAKYVKNNHLDIFKLISNIAKENRERQKELKVIKMKRIITEIYQHNGTVNKFLLSQHLGIKLRSLEAYKDISQLIKATILEIESK